MDACFAWLESASEEVDRLLDQYVETDMYGAVFEESDDQTAKNATIKDKAVTIVQNMINALRKIFSKIKEAINTAISWVNMDSSEETKYKKFVEECKKNPEFANKKVTYKDYQKAIDIYNKTLDKAEADYRGLKDDEAANRVTTADTISKDVAAAGERIKNDIEAGVQKAASLVASSGGELTASMTVQALLAKCKNSREEAIWVKNKIAKNEMLLGILEKELGKKEVFKFKAKVSLLNLKATILTKIGKARHREALTLSESIQAAIVGVDGVYRGSSKENKGPEAGNGKITANTVVNTAKILNRSKTTKGMAKKVIGTGASIGSRAGIEYARTLSERKEAARNAKALNEQDLKARENQKKWKEKQAAKKAKTNNDF